MSSIATIMHTQETECGTCDGDDAYVFAVRELLPEYLCCIPVGGSDSPPLAMPLCEECAQLSDADKGVRLMGALLRIPGARDRKPN